MTLDKWASLTLGDLGKWVTGSTPPSSDNASKGDDVLFVTPGDIGFGGKLGEVARRISNIGADKVRRIKPGSVILVCIGTIGKVAWTDREITTNQQINTLEVDQTKFDVKFVHWLLASPAIQQKLWQNSTSTTVALINKKTLEKIPCSVPPLDEQRRIVETLDDHLSKLDKALAELDHADIQTLVMRRSILHTLLNAQSTNSEPKVDRLGKGVMLRLKDVADGGLFCDGDWVESKDQDSNGTIRLLQLADIGDGEFRDKSSRWLRPDQAERIGVTYVVEGDIVIARMPDPLGRACIVPKLATPSITAVDVAILRVKREDVDSRWLMWWLNSPQTRAVISALASGTTRQRITRKNLEALDLFLPPKDEQVRVVEILDESISRLEAIRTFIAREKASLTTLRRALLNEAFNGELGTN